MSCVLCKEKMLFRLLQSISKAGSSTGMDLFIITNNVPHIPKVMAEPLVHKATQMQKSQGKNFQPKTIVRIIFCFVRAKSEIKTLFPIDPKGWENQYKQAKVRSQTECHGERVIYIPECTLSCQVSFHILCLPLSR